MARKPRTADDDLVAEGTPVVLSNSPIEDVRLPVFVPSEVVADATEKNTRAAAEVPPPKWYRVIKGGLVLEGGFRATLKPGKELNELNYNVRRLQQQGIVLEEIPLNEVGRTSFLE